MILLRKDKSGSTWFACDAKMTPGQPCQQYLTDAACAAAFGLALAAGIVTGSSLSRPDDVLAADEGTYYNQAVTIRA